MLPGPAGRVLVALALVLGGVAVTGCTPRITGPSLVLRLATPDPANDLTGTQVQHFADEVAARSGGSIRIEPVWDVTPNTAVGWDQTVARGVADGTWDMGLVPGRAWDELGVDSLRALTSPFLVTSQPALEAVLDSGLRDRLLAGLPAAGVTGVDLFPDELRHPFGYGKALLGPTDYAGQTVWSARSATVTHVLAALGASTTDTDADGDTGGSKQRGAEGSYSVARAQIATGNVTFFPKTDALVLRTSIRDRLRPDQWALLRSAAAETRHWLFTNQLSDQDDADHFCAKGGTIVGASAAQLADLRQATVPAVQWLRQDPGTSKLIDQIGALIDGVHGPPPPVSCPTRPPPRAADAQVASLDGTYIAVVTEQQLRRAGVSDPHLIQENSGHFTWILDDGAFTQHQAAHHFLQFPDLSGTYTYVDQVLTIHWPDQGGGPDTTTARLRVRRDGTILFARIRDADPELQQLSEGLFATPWTRVGGVPG